MHTQNSPILHLIIIHHRKLPVSVKTPNLVFPGIGICVETMEEHVRTSPVNKNAIKSIFPFSFLCFRRAFSNIITLNIMVVVSQCSGKTRSSVLEKQTRWNDAVFVQSRPNFGLRTRNKKALKAAPWCYTLKWIILSFYFFPYKAALLGFSVSDSKNETCNIINDINLSKNTRCDSNQSSMPNYSRFLYSYFSIFSVLSFLNRKEGNVWHDIY